MINEYFILYAIYGVIVMIGVATISIAVMISIKTKEAKK
jgi:hypothetical protein